jgi:hypothetical protein
MAVVIRNILFSHQTEAEFMLVWFILPIIPEL